MTGTVLYRKWRPQRFAEVVGQAPIMRTLKNAVAQGQAAHAYLFSGPRGTGKTSTGRILAKAVNCTDLEDGDPCGRCGSCRAIEEGRALYLLEIDAASNRGIDNIRELRENAALGYHETITKVYLIDEVHQLTGPAADALLKTLEEPPPHVLFILATTDSESLKPTVLSRCQRFTFKQVGVPEMRGRLREIAEAEGITIPDEALDLIAREATGSLRDAVNLLEQVTAAAGQSLTLEEAVAGLGLSVDSRALTLARAALRRDLKAGLAILAAVQADAVELVRFNRQVLTHLRHAMLLEAGAAEHLALSAPEREALEGLVDGAAPGDTIAALKAFNAADLGGDPYQTLPLELALAQLALAPELKAAAAPVRESPPRPRRAQPPGRTAPSRGREWGPQDAPAPSKGRIAERPALPSAGAAAARAPASPEEEMLLAIRLRLKERGKQHLAALLNSSCKVQRVDEETLTLGFFPNFLQFHKVKVEEEAETIAAEAGAVLGRSVTLHCVAADEESSRKSRLVAEAERLGAIVVGERDG